MKPNPHPCYVILLQKHLQMIQEAAPSQNCLLSAKPMTFSNNSLKCKLTEVWESQASLVCVSLSMWWVLAHLWCCQAPYVCRQMSMKWKKSELPSQKNLLWTQAVWCLSGHEVILNTPFMHAHIDVYYHCGLVKPWISTHTETHTHQADVVPPQHADLHKSRLLMGLSHRAALYFPLLQTPPTLFSLSLSFPCPSAPVHLQVLYEQSTATHILSGKLACCFDIQTCDWLIVCLSVCQYMGD